LNERQPEIEAANVPTAADGQARRASRQTLPRAFHLLYVGETVSLFGMQVTAVALPLVAAVRLGASAFTIGLLNATTWLPIILFGMVVGVLVDRHNKWRIMVSCNGIRALVLAVVPMLALENRLSIGALLVVAFTMGLVSVAFDVAYQSYIPDLIPEELLASANSRLELSRSATQLLGPLAGGAMVATMSPAYAIGATVITYAAATLTLLMSPVRTSARRSVATSSGDDSDARLLRALKQGQSAVWSTPALRIVVLAGGLTNIFVVGIDTLLVLFVVRILGLSGSYVGIALAFAGGGALLGAAAYTRSSSHLHEAGCVILGLGAMAAGGLALPLASFKAGLLFLFGSQLLLGFGTPMVNIALVTLRQKITPRLMLGRVNATARVLIMGSLPIGALAMGGVAQNFGILAGLWISSAGLCMVAAVFTPLIWRTRRLPSVNVGD
jgi:MFS family permease